MLEEAGDNLQPEKIDLAASPAVELARRIEQALATIPADEEAWKRVQSGIQQQFSELNDQLGMRGYHPQAEIIEEGVFAITCDVHGQSRTMTALRKSLSDELQSRDQMLNARERTVIENHLIGEVATELQGLIRSGEDWVRVVNEELDQRPASSGIKLRFVWEVDSEASDGLEAARRQLLKMTAAWSTAERDSIGRFLQAGLTQNGRRTMRLPGRNICSAPRLPRMASLWNSPVSRRAVEETNQTNLRHRFGRRKGPYFYPAAVRRRCGTLPECGSARAALDPPR